MTSSDLAYERLTSAWQLSLPPDLPVATLAETRRGGYAGRPRSAPHPVHSVLVACPKGTRPSFLSGRAVAALSSERANYVVNGTAWCSVEDLEQLLHEQMPRVLLIDVEVCVLLGLASLRHLRRVHAETDWLIGWNEPSPRWVEILLQAGALGCIRWNAPAFEFTRALDAILSGEVWFPRAVMGWIYMAFLDGAQQDSPSGPADAHGVAGIDLTTREAQTLALMRRGLTNKQIAERLDISINTVKKHLASAFEKRGLRSRRQVLD